MTAHPQIQGVAHRCAPDRGKVRRPLGRGQEGMMAVELVILVPIMALFLLLVVGLGRYTHGRQLVDDAAAEAARAASLTNSPTQAITEARRTAADTIGQGGVTCGQMSTDVNVAAFGPGGQVTVTVRCHADLSSLTMTGLPAAVTLTATSISPIETYRVFAS